MKKKWMILAAVLAAVLVIAFVAVHGVAVTAKVDGPGMENTEVKPDPLEGAQPAAAPEQAQDEAFMLDGEEEMDVEIYGLEGEIVELGEGCVVLSTAMHGMVQVNYTEDAIFEGVAQEDLAVGQYLFVDYNGMMSRSIPAQVTGLRLYAVMLSGVVSEVGEGSVTILQDETGMEIVIHLPETAGALAAGDHITATTNGAMTMSLPPQTSAAQIVVNGK